jgi:ubiquinone/menaquinone biosynthesis C-methylase UbiE
MEICKNIIIMIMSRLVKKDMHQQNSKRDSDYFCYVKSRYATKDYYRQFMIADFPEEAKILDVGCGLGLLLSFLSDKIKSSELCGVDVNQDILNEATKNCPTANFLKMDNENIPFLDNYFDVVFSLDVIEHVGDPSKHLGEIYRVMKSSGTLIICTPDRFAYYPSIYPADNKKEAIYHNLKRMIGLRMLDYTHRREYTAFKFRKLLKRTGFQVIEPNGLERIRKYEKQPFLARARNFQMILKRYRPFHGCGSMIYLVKKA